MNISYYIILFWYIIKCKYLLKKLCNYDIDPKALTLTVYKKRASVSRSSSFLPGWII